MATHPSSFSVPYLGAISDPDLFFEDLTGNTLGCVF